VVLYLLIKKIRIHTSLNLKIRGIKNNRIILQHFQKYSLQGQKWENFQLFEATFKKYEKDKIKFSNSISKSNFSTWNTTSKSYYILGFTDGDGSFSISFTKNLRIRFCFSIGTLTTSLNILEDIQFFFGFILLIYHQKITIHVFKLIEMKI